MTNARDIPVAAVVRDFFASREDIRSWKWEFSQTSEGVCYVNVVGVSWETEAIFMARLQAEIDANMPEGLKLVIRQCEVVEPGNTPRHETRDAPITEVARMYRYSEVINLSGVRIEQGLARYSGPKCEHKALMFDTAERRVWCKDCQRTVENFDAFLVLVNQYQPMVQHARRLTQEAEEARNHSMVSRAAKVVDQEWRGRNMAPCCTQCGAGILPEDFANGAGSAVSREYEKARRARKGAK